MTDGTLTLAVDPTPTDDDVAAFKKAWAEADESLCLADHAEGDRTRAGLAAVFALRAAR